MQEKNQNATKVIQLNATKSKRAGTSKQNEKLKKIKHSKRKAKVAFGSEVRTLALKFYPEQLLDEKSRLAFMKADDTQKQQIIKQLVSSFIEQIRKFHYLDFQVAMILHDSDKVKSADDPFSISIEKAHFHVIIRRASKKRFRVKRIIDLLGLTYIKDDNFDDTSMWLNGGAEIIRDFASYFLYLTHETSKAISDGKHQYDRSEVITNFDETTREALWQAGLRHQKKTKLDWEEIDDLAYSFGLNLKDFDAWTRANLTVEDRASKNYRVIQKTYEKGLSAGVARIGYVTRCSILLYGSGNIGKSYTSLEALKALHLNTYRASAGTGKYDDLNNDTDAIIFDDVGVSDARNVFDNLAVKLHRRNSSDRVWKGSYAVVTTNDDPDIFIQKMAGVNSNDELFNTDDAYVQSKLKAIEAIKQRLYICTIEDDHLVVKSATTRGSKADQAEHDKLFKKFAEKFNALLKNYKPKQQLEDNIFGNTIFKRAYDLYKRVGKDWLDEETLARALTYEVALKQHIAQTQKLDLARKDDSVHYTEQFFENVQHYAMTATRDYVGFSVDLALNFQKRTEIELMN